MINSDIRRSYVNYIGMEFIMVPAGEFEMGSSSDEMNWYRNEKPVHKVTINKAFYLSKYPVTQKQWTEIMGKNPSRSSGENKPVDRISWNDAQKFIEILNNREDTDKYRLPSEAEWEYTCRAGTNMRYSFGDSESELDKYCCFGNKDVGSHPVGQKKPNPWGFYDMHGNVWEWVQDVYHDSYEGAPEDGSAWNETDLSARTLRILRGGSWQTSAVGCRSASRYYMPPVVRRKSSRVGFRLLREI